MEVSVVKTACSLVSFQSRNLYDLMAIPMAAPPMIRMIHPPKIPKRTAVTAAMPTIAKNFIMCLPYLCNLRPLGCVVNSLDDPFIKRPDLSPFVLHPHRDFENPGDGTPLDFAT